MKLRYITLLSILCFSLQAFCQQAKVDSFKQALGTVKSDTIKMALLSELSFAYANNAPDVAMNYLEQQKAIADKINNPKYTANVLNDLAVIEYYKGDYTNALAHNRSALAIRKSIGDRALIMSSLSKVAVIYQELGNNDQATQYQLEVLQIATEVKNSRAIAATLNNICYLYEKVKKYDNALVFARRALVVARDLNDTLQLGLTYSGISNLYEQINQTDSAIHYALIAIDFFKLANALSELSAVYNDMGFLYRARGSNKEGLAYYKLALELANGLENKSDIAFYAANVGSTYVDIKQPDSGFSYLKKAYEQNGNQTRQDILKTIYGGLTTYFILKNKPDSAIHYNILYRDITDSLNATALTGKMNELLSKYETAQKEQQIVLLNEQNTIKQLTINRSNIIIGITAASLVIAILLSILFYNRYRLKQEARLKEEIIKQQNLASKAVIAAEELERQRIARDLHDGIGQMFSAVKMNLSGLADRIEIPAADERLLLNKTLALVDESCREVRSISHQMMPNILLKSGLSMAVRDFIEKIDESKLKVSLVTFGLHQPLDQNLETVLYRVIQESVNNVIKHAQASTLDIQLHKDAESISVTIEDNGKGFDPQKAEAAEGIGLKSIKARVAFLNGKVDYDSAPGRGTLIAIYIPNKH